MVYAPMTNYISKGLHHFELPWAAIKIDEKELHKKKLDWWILFAQLMVLLINRLNVTIHWKSILAKVMQRRRRNRNVGLCAFPRNPKSKSGASERFLCHCFCAPFTLAMIRETMENSLASRLRALRKTRIAEIDSRGTTVYQLMAAEQRGKLFFPLRTISQLNLMCKHLFSFLREIIKREVYSLVVQKIKVNLD